MSLTSKVVQRISSTATTAETFRLPDDRLLGYKSYGSPSGRPAFHFHGSPSCRLEAEDWDRVGRKLNVTVIGIDRPGMGQSTFKRDATLLDWPSDVHNLAKHLQLKTFHVFGGSGGGPFALACAYSLPKDVLLGTGVISGVAPPETGYEGAAWNRKLAFKVNAHLPWSFLRWLLDIGLGNSAQTQTPEHWKSTMEKVFATFSKEDHALLDQFPDQKERQIECYREAFSQ
ncbi:alpha/beta-hydrolase [Tothia fuscella]|uniref:Alpha/beta-hydrolase n=1 Tax=Tothia fuscella TaxID=1048955 RepID=A0A9P4U186_9PEZI|nr:alpha/beta-hydrolase [Tothia fuscella]